MHHEISLNVAYMAFKDVLAKYDDQQNFMAAHYTNDEIFFLSFAYVSVIKIEFENFNRGARFVNFL